MVRVQGENLLGPHSNKQQKIRASSHFCRFLVRVQGVGP